MLRLKIKGSSYGKVMESSLMMRRKAGLDQGRTETEGNKENNGHPRALVSKPPRVFDRTAAFLTPPPWFSWAGTRFRFVRKTGPVVLSKVKQRVD